MMDLATLKRELKKADPIVFCRQHLFDSQAWFFQNAATFGATGTYDEFRFKVGTLVNTSPNNISIVGSAKFGFSMAPEKDFRAFNSLSDIDVVIVSPVLFEDVWAQFRRALYSGYTWIQKRHRNEIIRRFIVLDASDKYETSYLRDVSLRLFEMRKSVQAALQISNTIKYRVYANWEDAEMYHAYGIEVLQERLSHGE